MRGKEQRPLDRVGREDRIDHRNRISGAVIGLVTDNKDPLGQGRVKVRYPWLHDSETSFWSRIAQPYAGSGRGSFWLPEVGDEVVVVFDRGDANHSFVLGGLWNGEDAPPPPGNPDGANNHKIWRTRNGHQLIFQDTDGSEKITLIDGKSERHLVIDVAADTITLTAEPGDITFEAPSNSLNIECKDLEIEVQNSSTWKVGKAFADVSDKRQETITGADTLKTETTWTVGAPSTSVSASTSSLAADTIGVSVSGSLTMSNVTGREIKAKEVRRSCPSEVLTAPMVEAHGEEAVAFVSNGPISLTVGPMMLDGGDQTLVSPAATNVTAAAIMLKAKTGLSALGQLVKLC